MPVFVQLTGLMKLQFSSHWIVFEDAAKRFLGWDLSKGNVGKRSNISLRKPSNFHFVRYKRRRSLVWATLSEDVRNAAQGDVMTWLMNIIVLFLSILCLNQNIVYDIFHVCVKPVYSNYCSF